MINTELQNVRMVIKKNSNSCKDIMTPWNVVCKNTKNPENDYDYVPVVKDNVVSGLYVKNSNEYNFCKINDDYFIDENSDLISVLEKLNNLYSYNKTSFLIIGDPNNQLGVINHSDLNMLPFIHIMWDIFYNFEIKITNSLKDKYDSEYILNKQLKGDAKKSYTIDKNNNQELEPIFYLSLSKKIDLYNKLDQTTDKIRVNAKFRNNMAHPKSKARVIPNKSEIPKLYKTIVEIDNFLS